MENNNGRRKFLKNTVKGVAVVAVSTAAAGSFLQSCSPSNTLSKSKAFTTGFDQTPLPYAYNALENIIDAKTMEIHYSKHAAAYSKALKEAMDFLPLVSTSILSFNLSFETVRLAAPLAPISP